MASLDLTYGCPAGGSDTPPLTTTEVAETDTAHVGNSTPRRDLRAEAATLWHMLTHFPKNIHCPICQVAKAQFPRHMRSAPGNFHNCEKFGDCITADYFTFDRHGPDLGIENMTNGLVIFDIATSFLDCQPTNSRDTEIT